MNDLTAALWRPETPLILGLALALSALLFRFLPSARSTLRHSLLFFAFWLLVDLLAALLSLRQPSTTASGLQQIALLGQGVALIRLVGLALFRLLLPALKIHAPRILEDIVVIGGYLVWGMVRLSFAGVDLTSLVATSAVITAVLAFAMQDTLGNVLGGLALQLDNSLRVGDWVKLDDLSGQVVDIQWRYTAILTRNGEKVVVPNSQLMKGKFSVLCDPDLGIPGWRRWVWFNIDYSVNPSQVIAAAERCVADAEIPNVARDPAPSCVAMEFGPGSVRYALRYWMIDPQQDDPTDSAVRNHLLASVQRYGWRIALPDQQVHLLKDGETHRAAVQQRELAKRLAVIADIDLFDPLDDAERRTIAERMVHSPFVSGDVMTRQGATAHWLYIIANGEADVVWESPSGERCELKRLHAGSFFGEMGLLTGAPRTATVRARTDVECYRLDKAGLEDIIRQRHEIAESLARILAQRQQEDLTVLDRFRGAKDDPPSPRVDLLDRIRGFFGLS